MWERKSASVCDRVRDGNIVKEKQTATRRSEEVIRVQLIEDQENNEYSAASIDFYLNK